MSLKAGSKVDYYMIWAGGPHPLGDWFKNYVVVEPISPYNPNCALIQKLGSNSPPFNAPFSHLRKNPA